MNWSWRMASALFIGAYCVGSARSAEAIDPDTASGVQVFLEVYQTLSQAHSAFFYELYSDRAQVVTDLPGRVPIRFQGVNYKAWGKELIARAQAFPDASRFDSPRIERRGNHLRVQASRYSLGRCYLDPRYSLTLEPYRNGYRIIEERLALQPAARCESQERGAPRSATGAGAPPALPRPAWRPMSAEEINATALRLAQQTPRPANPASVRPAAQATEAAAPGTKPSDLWVSPP